MAWESEDTANKMKYALELVKTPASPYGAALRIFGDNTGAAMKASHFWVNDPAVIAEVERIKEEFGELHFLPTKHQFARKIVDFADSALMPEDKLKGWRLYAEVMGYIDRPAIVNNNIQNNVANVLVVPAQQTEAQWEQNLIEQQTRLKDEAESRH